MSSYVTEARELARARPLRFRARTAIRRAALAGLRALPRSPAQGVRIVHYHYVFDDERASFARQLQFLAAAFEPVSLSEAVERLRLGCAEGREVAVTFDDGFRNHLVNAAPLLAEHGFRACFFLVTELVSAQPEQAARICHERLHLPRPVAPLTWEEAAELGELGHEIGSHTRSHPNLVGLPPTDVNVELSESRAEIERRLGSAAVHFSAPYGDRRRFTPAVSEAVRRAGYASCATAFRGRNLSTDDVFALHRDHLVAGWPVADVRYFLSRA